MTSIHTYLHRKRPFSNISYAQQSMHVHSSLSKFNYMDTSKKKLSPTWYAKLRLFHSCLRWRFRSWMFTNTSDSIHQTPTVMIPRACTGYPASITVFQALYRKSHHLQVLKWKFCRVHNRCGSINRFPDRILCSLPYCSVHAPAFATQFFWTLYLLQSTYHMHITSP